MGPFSKALSADIEAIESEIGRSLPEDYRRFIDQCHGGNVDYSIDLPPGGEGEALVASGRRVRVIHPKGQWMGRLWIV